MSEDAKQFAPDSFDGDGDTLVMAPARVTLRLALNDPDSKIDHPNNFFSLYERIETLMAAYVNSKDRKVDADSPSAMLSSFANAVAMTIALAPSLRAAVAAHLAATPDSDP
jgi:hypothetical protein